MAADADVVVVGAGPAGSALATMLGRAGRKTILLDRASFPRDKPCGEGLMPAGVRVLETLGLPLDSFPALAGVTYVVPGAGSVDGTFATGVAGRGTRRLVLDQLLAEVAAATANVEALFGCEATSVGLEAAGVNVDSSAGLIRARYLVGADGQRSVVTRCMGWRRPARRPHRYSLVSHLDAPKHGFSRVVVSLLPGCEVYLAPTSQAELLVAMLGSKTGLRKRGEPAREAYARRLAEAHPRLAGCSMTTFGGAGPFWTRPASVAAGSVFLVGDAAGFADPLTGDGITAGLLASQKVAEILAAGRQDPASEYRRWAAKDWRRRVFMGRLALALTGSSRLARRAVGGLQRRPAALGRLLEVNDGSRSPLSLRPADLAALVGI